MASLSASAISVIESFSELVRRFGNNRDSALRTLVAQALIGHAEACRERVDGGGPEGAAGLHEIAAQGGEVGQAPHACEGRALRHRGPSGLGKTALLEQWLAMALEIGETPLLISLRGSSPAIHEAAVLRRPHLHRDHPLPGPRARPRSSLSDAGKLRSKLPWEVVTAWVWGGRRDLDLALAALSEDPFPDDPAWLDGEDGELAEPADARLALEYATAALVAGEVDLARHIYVYAQVAARDPGHLPALLSMLTAVAGHLDDQPPPPTARAPRSAGRLRGVGPQQVR